MNLEDTKKYLLVFIPGLSLLFFNYGNYWSSHWYSKWSLLVAVFSVLYSFSVARKTSLVLFPVIVLSLLSAAYVSVWFNNIYRLQVDATMMSALQSGAMYSYISVIMATLAIVFIPKGLSGAVQNFLGLVCLLSAIYTIFEFNLPAYERGAFSGNASMNASLIACLLPFAMEYSLSLAIPFCLLAITSCILTHSSIGIGTLVVVVSTYLCMNAGISIKWMASIAAGLSAPLLLALKYIPAVWLSSSGRVSVWKAVFSWWYTQSSVLFGAGLGTGISLFPTIQKLYQVTGPGYMLWLHSDWLQVAFELGFAGFVSLVAAYVYLCFRSCNRPHLFSSLIGFGTCAIADYPIRLPIHCTAMTLLTWLILQNKRTTA